MSSRVLQVVVVGCRATALDLGKDAAARFKAEDEVGPNLRREPDLASKGHLLIETELLMQQTSHDPLHIPALGAINVDGVDVLLSSCEVASQPLGQCIDTFELPRFGVGEGATDVPPVPDEHREQLHSYEPG